MNDIGFTLSARNSSGEQTLAMSEHNGEFWFTLCGTYNGKPIQIDFDTLTKSEMEDIKAGIEILIQESK
jgi:hypothetical protein